MTTEASCTEPGLKTFTCELCGEELSTEEIPAAGHIPREPETTKNATLFSDGEELIRCTVCGEILEMKTVQMDAAQKNKYYAGIAALAVVVIATIVIIVKRKNKKSS